MAVVRCFVAVDLPEELKAAADAVGQDLRRAVPPGVVRWTPRGSFHLTLKFLGDVEEEQLPPLLQALERALAPQAGTRLTLAGLGCFPTPRRPAVVWLGAGGPGLAQLVNLVECVEATLEPLGFPRERRPFAPHLTLGRVARDARSGDVRRLGALLERTVVAELGSWDVREAVLMRSTQTPQGPEYSPLAVVGLGKAE